MPPDPRLNAWREDLADERLRGAVTVPRYAVGRPARVITGVAPVRRAPDMAAATVTFQHYGETALVFEDAGGFAWCQSQFDAYVGYVETRHLAPGTPAAPTHFVATLGCYVYDAPDLRAPARDFLPRHSAVALAERDLVTRGTAYGRLDSGFYVPSACLAAAPPRSPDLAAAAALYLGCPYLWGGRSWLGLDCSGLVQSAFRDLGATVPRDTDLQQQTIGAAAEFDDPRSLRRGDLLYLPGHVLIGSGDGAVIHADGAGMSVRRDDLAELMRARGWTAARFVLRRP